jgi:hypothetical protein
MTEPPKDPWATPPGGQPETSAYGQPAAPGPPPSAQPGAPYGQPAYGYPGPTGPRNGLGTAALVCGIVGVVLCFTVVLGIVLGVLALVFGLIGRGRAKRGEATNRGHATAGVVLGIIGVVLSIVFIVIYVLIANSSTFKNYNECLNAANGDQAKISQCEQDFRNNFGN